MQWAVSLDGGDRRTGTGASPRVWEELVFPLKFNMQGPQVADLHSALLALLDRAFILPGDEGVRQAAAAALQAAS